MEVRQKMLSGNQVKKTQAPCYLDLLCSNGANRTSQIIISLISGV